MPPDALVLTVYVLSVDAVELTHPLGEVGFRGFDDQMVVIGHLAPGVAVPIESLANGAQDGEPLESVGIVEEDVLTPVTSRGDVVETAGKFDAQGAGHGGRLEAEGGKEDGCVAMQDLTPIFRFSATTS
jgi:hypothetical protein